MCHPLNMFLDVFVSFSALGPERVWPTATLKCICYFNPDTAGRSSCHLSASQIFLLFNRFSPLPRYTKGVKLDIVFLGSSAKMPVSNQSPFDSLEGTRCPVPTQSHPSFLPFFLPFPQVGASQKPRLFSLIVRANTVDGRHPVHHPYVLKP